jgi:hypothetical protein
MAELRSAVEIDAAPDIGRSTVLSPQPTYSELTV